MKGDTINVFLPHPHGFFLAVQARQKWESCASQGNEEHYTTSVSFDSPLLQLMNGASSFLKTLLSSVPSFLVVLPGRLLGTSEFILNEKDRMACGE